MSAIDDIIKEHAKHDPRHGYEKRVAATAELAQLRAELQAAQERIAELTQDDRYCPLCTWRGPVELVNGVCPQCDVDWPKEYREHRNALIVAQERISEQARQLAEARKAFYDYESIDDTIAFAMRELACIIPADEILWHTWLLRQADVIDSWLAANPAPQERIAALENDIVCAFCGTHYHADDVPPQHYMTCEASPLVQRIAEQARQLDEARYCITRRLRYHKNYPPVSSARWTDRENGIPGEDARDCDCDYCIEDRAWLAANPAPQEKQP